jgi:hypothetical protein
VNITFGCLVLNISVKICTGNRCNFASLSWEVFHCGHTPAGRLVSIEAKRIVVAESSLQKTKKTSAESSRDCRVTMMCKSCNSLRILLIVFVLKRFHFCLDFLVRRFYSYRLYIKQHCIIDQGISRISGNGT